MFAHEAARQRIVLLFRDDAFSDPLPELRLRGPELFAVAADDERGLLSLLAFIFFRGQLKVPFRQRHFHPRMAFPALLLFHLLGSHAVPLGEASLARQHQ